MTQETEASNKKIKMNRLTTELKSFSENPVFGISAGPIDDDNMMHWKAIISNLNTKM